MNTLKFGNGEWYGKKDTILAYNDLNSNYKPLLFDFSRDSSATVINKDGLIETVGSGEPRIDYKDDSKGALLLEPQRTNLLPYSEDFSFWDFNGAVMTPNQSLSPSGSLDASLVSAPTSGDRFAEVVSSTGGTYTFSFYIKAKEGESGIWSSRVVGDSTSVIDTQVNDTIWTRVENTFTLTGAGNLIVYPVYNRSSTSTLFNAYIYGAQLEQGSYATSYIPTQGSIVTRNQDVCNNGANDQVINSTEGTMYVNLFDIKSQSFDSITLNDNSGTDNNQVRIWFFNNTTTYQYNIGGTASAQISSSTINLTSENKICCTWKLNEFKLYINGIKIGEDVLGNVLSASVLKSLDFKRGSGAGSFYGNVKDVKLYNTALTDQELIALTS